MHTGDPPPALYLQRDRTWICHHLYHVVGRLVCRADMALSWVDRARVRIEQRPGCDEYFKWINSSSILLCAAHRLGPADTMGDAWCNVCNDDDDAHHVLEAILANESISPPNRSVQKNIKGFMYSGFYFWSCQYEIMQTIAIICHYFKPRHQNKLHVSHYPLQSILIFIYAPWCLVVVFSHIY